MRRVFAAIDISDEARFLTDAYIRAMRRKFPSGPIRWERAEKLHLTIRFVGNVDDRQLKNFLEIVDRTARQIPQFNSRILSTGVFPTPKRARILWLGLDHRTESLTRIKELFEGQLAGLGLAPDRLPWKPHLTIARVKEPGPASDAIVQKHLDSNFGPVDLKVSEIVIYESTLRPRGPVFSIISRHGLK